MIATILVFALAFALSCFSNTNRKKALGVSFFILFVFLALRYNFGNDYPSYRNIHEIISIYGTKTGMLPYRGSEAFTFFNSLFDNFYVMIAAISAIYCYIVYRLIAKNTDRNYFGLAVFILCFNPYLLLIHSSSLRQAMAILIFIVAVDFAYNKKLIPYLLLIYLATLFHNTAVLLYPAYFIIAYDNKRVFKIAILVSILISILAFGKIQQKIYEISLMLVGNNANTYIEGENTLRATLLSSIYLLLCFVSYSSSEKKDSAYLRLYMVGLVFAIFAYRVSMLTRIQMYFDIFSVVAIPVALKTIEPPKFMKIEKNTYRVIWMILLIAIYLLRYYSFMVNPMWQSFTVYRTILFR